jgi:hypothetical protein
VFEGLGVKVLLAVNNDVLEAVTVRVIVEV